MRDIKYYMVLKNFQGGNGPFSPFYGHPCLSTDQESKPILCRINFIVPRT